MRLKKPSIKKAKVKSLVKPIKASKNAFADPFKPKKKKAVKMPSIDDFMSERNQKVSL